MARTKSSASENSAANLGFEAKLWLAAAGEPFEEKMPRLVAELRAQFAESAKLEQAIKKNLGGLGYEC